MVEIAIDIPLTEVRRPRFGAIAADAVQIVQRQTFPSKPVVRNDRDMQYRQNRMHTSCESTMKITTSTPLQYRSQVERNFG